MCSARSRRAGTTGHRWANCGRDGSQWRRLGFESFCRVGAHEVFHALGRAVQPDVVVGFVEDRRRNDYQCASRPAASSWNCWICPVTSGRTSARCHCELNCAFSMFCAQEMRSEPPLLGPFLLDFLGDTPIW